jgi:hypothetical protein
MTWQEQRVALYTTPGNIPVPVTLAANQIIGWQGTSAPINLQDFSNSGISLPRGYTQLGVELIWAGNPTCQLVVQGSLTNNPAAMSILSSPTGGSQNPDFFPPDDGPESLPIGSQPTFGSQQPNLVNLTGAPGSALLTWDLTKVRINYLQVLVLSFTGGSGTLLATASLMYLT